MYSAKILGIQGHLPAKVETNDDLARENPEWDMNRIAGKTGIVARHIAAVDETASDLGYVAAAELLAKQIVPTGEIDYLIMGTQTPDHFLPSDSCILQHRLGLGKHIGAFDYRLGCSGYVCGLQLAKALVETGAARNVLLITADTYSKFIHPQDRTVRALFGDGAAATIVGRTDLGEGSSEVNIGPFVTGTDGSMSQCLTVPAGAFRLPRSAETMLEHRDASGSVRSQNDLYMDGQAIFSFALNTVPAAIKRLLAEAKLPLESVDWWVFHQANRFMLENLVRCCGVPESKMVYAMEHVGNTVSASIPLAIESYQKCGKIQPGQRLGLVGFGVGLSWNACIVRI
jgi:3-oxoacyl-[acyl-carrier-protein] synthase III